MAKTILRLLDGREFLVERMEGKWIIAKDGTRFRRGSRAIAEVMETDFEEADLKPDGETEKFKENAARRARRKG